MKNLYLLFFLFSCLTAAGQKNSFGIRAGVSSPGLDRYDEKSEGYKARQAVYAGFLFDHKINFLFSLQLELNYSPQGGTRSEIQSLPPNISSSEIPNVKLYARYSKTAIIHYVEIPVLFKVTLGSKNKLKYNMTMGPYISLLLNARTRSSGYSLLYLDEAGNVPLTKDGNLYPAVSINYNADITKSIKFFNAGMAMGAGLAYTMGNGNVFIDGRMIVGLTNIQADPSANGKNQTGSLVFSAGYIFNLGKAGK